MSGNQAETRGDDGSGSLGGKIIIFVVTELFAFPFCFEAGSAFVNGDNAKALFGYAVGVPIAIFGFIAPWLAKRVRLRWIVPWAPIAIILAFGYLIGPDLYRRAMQPQAVQVAAPSAEEVANAVARKFPYLAAAQSAQSTGAAADETEKAAVASVRAERDAALANAATVTKERDELRAQQQSSLPKSPIGLDDAKRFQLIRALHDATANGVNGRAICHTMVQEKPNAKWAENVWADLAVILNYSGWLIEGTRTVKTYLPSGVTLSITKDSGDGFNCAFRLSELLVGLKIPTALRDNQVTPDLIACEKENPTHGCIEIVVGDEH